MTTADPAEALRRHLTLGTLSFGICFAAWGLISAFAVQFRQRLGLSGTETALLVAVPVILGSIARLPMGILADRFGARKVFSILMMVVAVPVFLVPQADTYRTLLVTAFFLGLAGSSFAVGVSYVSRWSPPSKQGGALGIYGVGNIGQSAAVFLGPVLAVAIGWERVFTGLAVALFAWGVSFWLLARDAPAKGAPKGIGDMLALLMRERLSWLLSSFYFLTFGGFVAFAIYLPTLLKDDFGLTPADAGFRAAGFVVIATLLRPVGGALADRIGGSRVLNGVFLGIIPFALLLSWKSMIPFTVGALGCAALLGLGNGAVFKLVPQYFPNETGAVTGLVGAMGGLGGFFPPLLLGFFRDRTGAVWPGFVLLAAVSFGLFLLNRRILLPTREAIELDLSPEQQRVADQLRAFGWATMLASLLVAAIVVGSRNLQNFDAALVIYTFASVFAAWGVAFHYAVWLQKPPTRIFFRRGFELAWRRGLFRSLPRLASVSGTHLLGQTFIYHRSPRRWWMHQFLFWGCLLAAAITFPLVFGWVHFGTLPDDPFTYVTYVFGFPTASFRVRTVFAWLLFHGLDVAALLVLAGIALSLGRRMRDNSAMTAQSFGMDFFPLILLFAISVTGLALTASTLWLRGQFYGFLSILHAITVIAALLYLPFGKFFHMFQRPAQLGVKLYQDAGEAGPGAHCASCGERFASRMHIDDLNTALPELGFHYEMPGPARTWQEICPACKRKTIARAQTRLKEESLG
ncbi:MAG: MFS transporter [Vicinamibacteria bacterium]|nr:MFS transporter [Vicinamibacteria bacterium]